MRKIKFLVCVVFVMIYSNSFSQEKFTTYETSYAKGSYDIQISTDSAGSVTLWVNALSLDDLSKTGGFSINEKHYQPFIDALNEASLKYEEWVKTAKANNINDLNKKMSIKSKVKGYFLYGDKWHFQYLVDLTFEFMVLKSGGEIKYLLLVRTGELQSSSNQFIDMDGFVLVFSSTDEIKTFVNEISLQKIQDFNNKPKAEDLFK